MGNPLTIYPRIKDIYWFPYGIIYFIIFTGFLRDDYLTGLNLMEQYGTVRYGTVRYSAVP